VIRWYSVTNDSVVIGNGSNLMVSTVGSYYCRVVHGNTMIRSCPAHVSLIEFKEPSDSKENKTMGVHRTNDVILSSCQHVYSIPPPTIKWMFVKENGVSASLPKSTFQLPSGNLLISNLKYNIHFGVYYCIATNKVTGDSWQSPTTELERHRSGIVHVLSNLYCDNYYFNMYINLPINFQQFCIAR